MLLVMALYTQAKNTWFEMGHISSGIFLCLANFFASGCFTIA